MGCPRRIPARRRLLVSAVQTVALLLGCLVVAVGLTHATIAACPELAAALGGTAARGPAPTQGFMPPPNSPELEKMQFLMRRGALFKVGAEAPDFTLPDASGRPVRLGSFRGKRPVVLVFGSFG